MARRFRFFSQALAALMLCIGGATHLEAQEGTTSKDKLVVFFGVYTQWYKFDQALPNYELKVCNAHSQRVQDFPSVKDLFHSKALILSDVTGAEFTDAQIKLIRSYVERGGGLLITGGPFTLGLGQFKEKGLEEMLPVELSEFDLKWEKQGKSFTKATESPMLQGVDFSQNPMVYWIHKLKPKEGAHVVLTAGEYPLLIEGSYGKGRVVVFTGTPLGIPQQGQTPFWEWSDWSKLIQNAISYLVIGEAQQ